MPVFDVVAEEVLHEAPMFPEIASVGVAFAAGAKARAELASSAAEIIVLCIIFISIIQ